MIEQERLISGLSDFADYLGEVLGVFSDGKSSASLKDGVFERWENLLNTAYIQNPWFTKEQVLFALAEWKKLLHHKALIEWVESYPKPGTSSKTVALILAGNIPLVGFHDLLSVLISGNTALVKYPSNDKILLPFLIEEINTFVPGISECVSFTEGKLSDFDAVIATGSDNTSRYFEYYFASKPHIIRKNRNSVAVLTGKESTDELNGLAEDVFRYFGMGCRSVSKIYVPEEYNFDALFNSFFKFQEVIHHQKYANNYDYNKAVYLMSGAEMLDNGFLLLKEDSGFGSPIGTLFFEYYSDINLLKTQLKANQDKLQCIVAGDISKGIIPFGKSQQPELSTYADGVDTLKFLMEEI
jgi:hypothetical protein